MLDGGTTGGTCHPLAVVQVPQKVAGTISCVVGARCRSASVSR
ncbi:hypothetical protein EE36_15092 [Sulfitobacter sp. EE-36]|nr:hypothetical protein EE36_15092 [Sulfitobacter sp. EE-36]